MSVPEVCSHDIVCVEAVCDGSRHWAHCLAGHAARSATVECWSTSVGFFPQETSRTQTRTRFKIQLWNCEPKFRDFTLPLQQKLCRPSAPALCRPWLERVGQWRLHCSCLAIGCHFRMFSLQLLTRISNRVGFAWPSSADHQQDNALESPVTRDISTLLL